MNNNHRITLNTNKNIIVEFTNERIIPASGLAVVGALLGKSDFIKKLNRMDVTSNQSQHVKDAREPLKRPLAFNLCNYKAFLTRYR